MIKGSITIHDEPTTFTYTAYEDDAYYGSGYQSIYRVPLNFEQIMEDTIADALAKGFHIGAKVRKKMGMRVDVGEILHFDKKQSTWKEYHKWCETIVVKWSNSFTSNWHQDELILIPDSEKQNEPEHQANQANQPPF